MTPPLPPPAAILAAAPQQIGAASMEPDGTIVMLLRAEKDGAVADGMVRVAPGEPDYARVKRHLPGLRPGRSVPVFDDWR